MKTYIGCGGIDSCSFASMPIRWSKSSTVLLMIAALPLSGCAQDSDTAESADNTSVESAPASPSAQPGSLKAIMRVLASDVAGLAMGIWLEEPTLVRDAAQRIADHPRVPAEQLAVIQAELGQQFAAFVQYDQQVHDASVQLAGLAAASSSSDEWLRVAIRIQTDCVACHSTFRASLVPVLNPGDSALTSQ